MPESGQIRINELARELEIKAKTLIEYLPEIGVAEKKTHSSSLEHDQAERGRKHFRDLVAAEAAAEAEKQAKAAAAKVKPGPPAAAPPSAQTSPVAQRPGAPPAQRAPIVARPAA